MSKQINKLEIKEKEVSHFICDCQDRDHIIIGNHFVSVWNTGTIENELYLVFVVWHNYHRFPCKTYFCRIQEFFAEKWWRIKEAMKLILFGSLRIEDTWIPYRGIYHPEGRNPNGVNGEDEAQKLAEWILDVIKISRNNVAKFKEKYENR